MFPFVLVTYLFYWHVHPHHVAYVTSSATVSLLDGKWNEYYLSEFDTKTGTRPEQTRRWRHSWLPGSAASTSTSHLGPHKTPFYKKQPIVFAAASARAAHPAEREPTCQPSAADGRRSTGERHDPAGTGGGTCHATLGRATRNTHTHTHTHVIVATAVINRNINAFTYGSAVLIEKSWPKQARHA